MLSLLILQHSVLHIDSKQQGNLPIHSLLISGSSSQIGKAPGPSNRVAPLQVSTHRSSLKEKQSSIEMVRKLLSESHSGKRVRQRKGMIASIHSSLGLKRERPFTSNIACPSLDPWLMDVGMLMAGDEAEKHSCKAVSSALQTCPE